MSDVRPFRALRPVPERAHRVIAPPYDVLTEAEARALAQEPLHFVHVTRSEVDLPVGTDSHSEKAYQTARFNLDHLRVQGVLVEDPTERFYAYAQTWRGRRQVAILGGASVVEYDQGLIVKHELTRPDKEDDRTHHMETLGAQVGLVFLAYRANAALAALRAELTSGKPDWTVKTEDEVTHEFWACDPAHNERVIAAFAALDRLYVADGHHRSAAASRVYAKDPGPLTSHFIVGIFGDDELQILPYNRLVLSLGDQSPEAFLAKVAEKYRISPGQPEPAARGTVSMYFQGGWHSLVAKPEVIPADPVGALDVSVLQDQLLGPILGIDDPRRSQGIEFVGGIRGPGYLQEGVDSGRAAVGFSMFPTGLDQLFAVADAGQVMPPKSTWFEPKLREGVVSKRIR